MVLKLIFAKTLNSPYANRAGFSVYQLVYLMTDNPGLQSVVVKLVKKI